MENGSWDSSVSNVTDCGIKKCEFHPLLWHEFFLFYYVYAWSVAYPLSHPLGIAGSVPVRKEDLELSWAFSFELKSSGTITSIPQYVFMSWLSVMMVTSRSIWRGAEVQVESRVVSCEIGGARRSTRANSLVYSLLLATPNLLVPLSSIASPLHPPKECDFSDQAAYCMFSIFKLGSLFLTWHWLLME
jgi:hypothetical protein